jgi:hypothetical protein
MQQTFLLTRSGAVTGEVLPPPDVERRSSPEVLRVGERYFARCTDGHYWEVSGLDASLFTRMRINGHPMG